MFKPVLDALIQKLKDQFGPKLIIKWSTLSDDSNAEISNFISISMPHHYVGNIYYTMDRMSICSMGEVINFYFDDPLCFEQIVDTISKLIYGSH